MTKKRSIITLCIVIVLTLIGLFLTFFKFIIPTTHTTFKGFFNAINYGYDVNGGYLAIYKPYDDSITGYDLDNKVKTTVSKLNSSLSELGFHITQQDSNIRVEISNVSYSEIVNKYSGFGLDVFKLLGSSNGVTFSSSKDNEKAEGYVGGEYVDSCTYGYSSAANSWYITVEFNEEGKVKFKELTQEISGGDSDKSGLYMWLDGTCYNGSGENSNGFSVPSATSSLTLTATSEQAAQAMAIQISTLAKPMLFSQVVNDSITAGLNSSAGVFMGNEATLLLVALGVTIIASMIFLCVRYRIFGVMASLSILIFFVLYTFLLQSIPLVILDFNGIMGTLVIYALLISGFVSIFEKIRSEYAIGKKIPNSVTSGFRKNLLPVLEKYVFAFILSIFFYIFGPISLQNFAISIFIGLFINYFTLFVVTRGLCKNYLPINSTNKKLYNLKREALKNEI